MAFQGFWVSALSILQTSVWVMQGRCPVSGFRAEKWSLFLSFFFGWQRVVQHLIVVQAGYYVQATFDGRVYQGFLRKKAIYTHIQTRFEQFQLSCPRQFGTKSK